MKTFTIQTSDQIGLDIQWLHGVLYHAFNQTGVDGYIVEIKDKTTITVDKEKSYSDIAITGAMFDNLQSIAKSKGTTLAKLLEELDV